METDSSDEENKDSVKKTPIYNFKSPDNPFWFGSSLDKVPTVGQNQSCGKPSTSFSLQTRDGLSVGYPVVPSVSYTLSPETNSIFHRQSADYIMKDVSLGAERAPARTALPDGVEMMELEEDEQCRSQCVAKKARRSGGRKEQRVVGLGENTGVGAAMGEMEEEEGSDGARDKQERREASNMCPLTLPTTAKFSSTCQDNITFVFVWTCLYLMSTL